MNARFSFSSVRMSWFNMLYTAWTKTVIISIIIIITIIIIDIITFTKKILGRHKYYFRHFKSQIQLQISVPSIRVFLSAYNISCEFFNAIMLTLNFKKIVQLVERLHGGISRLFSHFFRKGKYPTNVKFATNTACSWINSKIMFHSYLRVVSGVCFVTT